MKNKQEIKVPHPSQDGTYVIFNSLTPRQYDVLEAYLGDLKFQKEWNKLANLVENQ